MIMFKLQILNSKQAKEITGIISSHWDASLKMDYAFLVNGKNRVFIINRDVGSLDLSALRINSMGLYFGELKDGRLRLSIEGSQLIGPHASKNVVNITKKEMMDWLRGMDLQKDCESCSGFVIVKCNDDFLGCGSYYEGKIKNFVPKTRRVRA